VLASRRLRPCHCPHGRSTSMATASTTSSGHRRARGGR
jgi:hypothetical protein